VAQINDLTKLDPPPVDYSNFSPTMKRWLSDSVDILNQDVQFINNWFTNVMAVTTVNIGGGGATPPAVTVLGLPATGSVKVTLLSTSNAGVKVASTAVAAGQFTVTFDSDPGASAIIRYVAFITAP
jgi:hypothetical protein